MSTHEKSLKESLSIEYIYMILKRKWYVFAVSVILCIVFAYIKNNVSLPVYEVGASVLIKENKPQSARGASQLFEGFGLFNNENNFVNEIQVLKSSPLIDKVVKNLDVVISYYCHNFYNKKELYKTSPFVVVLNQDHPQLINVEFQVEILDNQTFKIKAKSKNGILHSYSTGNTIQNIRNFKLKQTHSFKERLESEYYDFKIILNKDYQLGSYNTSVFSFILNNPATLVKKYQSMLVVEPSDMESSIAKITARSTVPSKAVDIIKTLTNAYLEKDLGEKIYASIKTIEYIDNQLGEIGDSLRNAELNLQRFRTSNQIIDVTMKSGRVYDQLQELGQEKANIMVKLKYYKYIEDYFDENKEISDLIAPSSMGIEDPLLNNLIQELTTLNAERTSLIENNQGKSPYLKQINIKIDNLKNTISENIKYILNTTDISLKDIDSRISTLNSELNKLPATERQLLGYERKFNLNDAIYTYLLEKRAEAQITKASNMPDAQILEPAGIMGNGPISPKKRMNYIISILLGIVAPFTVIRLIDVLQNRITENTEIEKLTDIPLIGKIYNNNKKTDLVVNVFPKSHIAESFRRIRTSLNYFIELNKCSVITITSSFAQEGKSFISLNLALSLASINKKTILMNFDLRKPKVYERLNIKNDGGISNYLCKQAKYDDILQHSNVEYLDVITSGPIPPNPSELISSDRTLELLELAKTKYDYIILDTPPVGIISDTYILMEKSDLTIFVVRQSHTPKREFLSTIQDLKERNFKKICLVVNDKTLYKSTKYGYGYYDVDEKKN